MTAGHSTLFFPKYHCEFNFIESVWNRLKDYARRNCTYSFTALHTTIPKALDSIPLAVIHRYAQRCDRFMDAYREKDFGLTLTPKQVERVVKKYKSHRRIPMDIATQYPEVFTVKIVCLGIL